MAPSNVSIQHVLAPSDKLKLDMKKLLSDLSADDPGLLALVGNDPSLIPILVGTWVEDGSVIGELWTATEGDELVGFMLWTPPGATSKISKEERLEFQQPLLDALSPEGLEYFKRTYYDEFPTFVMQSIAPALLDEVWWLRVAMVRADRQGRGIARALLEPVRQKVSALGQDIACSATRARNVAVYNGLGFESRGVREMVSPWHTWSLYVFLLPPQKL
ncbi:hypothetical protein K466DRAFT_585985 [Polyporus arcularius HHB13444]|uniref:N-acetyltransferase domain-containing protein n=1 Tax=Polyporus arcularius HHB13444 TaxID=1314778 RepID=A0A5C3PH46_9APHY|nr:hypothetical protein K466DRAFT_585985 [Polyporus arcularius HHB13444]